MASAVDSRLAYARLSAVATASRLPTANRGSNNSYTTSWDTTALGSTSGGRSAETHERLVVMRHETARLIKGVGREQKQREEELTKKIDGLYEKLGQNIASKSGLRGAFETSLEDLNDQIAVIESLESGIADREEKIGKLQDGAASLAKQRDGAVSERNDLTADEEAGAV